MTTRERFRLSAWKKWTLYGRFPWKFVFHIILLFFTTMRLVTWNQDQNEYFRATSRTFSYFFLPEDYDFPAERVYTLYTYEKTREAVARLVKNYETINEYSVDTYKHFSYNPEHSKGAVKMIEPVRLVLERFKGGPGGANGTMPPGHSYFPTNGESAALETLTINVTSGDMGPFDTRHRGAHGGGSVESVDRVITNMYKAAFQFRLKGFNIVGSYMICVVWTTTLTFDFSSRGMIKLYINADPTAMCKDVTWSQSLYTSWIDIPILCLSVGYILLAVKKLRQQISLYLYLKRRALLRENRRTAHGGADQLHRSHRWLGAPVTWNSLRWSDRCGFFDLWFIFTIVACVCSAITSVIGIFDYQTKEGRIHRLLGSLGCSLLWVNLVRYLQYNRNYYMVILTMRRGGPRVLRFMVGVLPIMMGYAFFGMTYFGSESDRFETFGASMVTLFAVLNGDVIRETFLNLMPVYPVMSQVYLYTFISLFMYVVLNVFIAIIEEAFFVSAAIGTGAGGGGGGGGGGGADQGFHGHGNLMTQGMGALGEAHRTTSGDTRPPLSASLSSVRSTSVRSTREISQPVSISARHSTSDVPAAHGNLAEGALNASAKSWSRFQEFLHVNNIDEVMDDVQSDEGSLNASANGMETLASPLLSGDGGTSEGATGERR